MRLHSKGNQISISPDPTMVVGLALTATTMVVGRVNNPHFHYHHGSGYGAFFGLTHYHHGSPFNITIGIGLFLIEENTRFDVRRSQQRQKYPVKIPVAFRYEPVAKIHI